MKKLIVLFIATSWMFLNTPLIYAQQNSQLELIKNLSCDNDTSDIKIYKDINGNLSTVMVVKSKKVFNIQRQILVEKFFIDQVEVTHEQFDETLSNEAPQLYNVLHRRISDCKEVINK